MLKMPCLDMITRPKTFAPLLHCIINDLLPSLFILWYFTFLRSAHLSWVLWGLRSWWSVSKVVHITALKWYQAVP